MNRPYISGAAAGIFLATSVFTAYYLSADESTAKRVPLSSEDAHKTLQEDGYHVLSKSEWDDYQKNLQSINQLKTENQQSNKEETVAIKLSIKPGMATDEIISLLKEERVIEDTEKFSTYLNDRDLTKKIQTGTYTVYKNMDYAALSAILTKGK
ncbi:MULTISPECIES: endolytic transglycosylase MltG [unclassified Bacillus (in: firmicutes)]|uniref:endolytic transglycosylase MltG n=1 Tax=unclassified Bacillus (in: firmicutes) TaxID=185979 RepID=UPI00111F66DF|nr:MULTISPECIES: endolytic transglycosylase MltG [unclassified Bacillus (in: firmicutes)]